MNFRVIAVLAAGVAAWGSALAETQSYEASFAPLPKSERQYSKLGPVGPFYPEPAFRAGRSGEATLECKAGGSGVLERCKVMSEAPTGFHFGDAARIMADRKRIHAAGSPPSGETILVRVPFVLGAPVDVEP